MNITTYQNFSVASATKRVSKVLSDFRNECARAHAHTRANTQARAHARTRTHTHTCTYYIICRAPHIALSNEFHCIHTRISSTSFRSGCQLQRTIILFFKPPPFPDCELVLSILNTNANPRLAANLKPKISGHNGYRRSHTIS
jgi:hypothetical protein